MKAPFPALSLEIRPPTVDEYRRLRASAKWWPVEDAATAEALGRALISVCAVCGGETVGCARLVGDGGLYVYVQDVIVLPEHRGRGIGRAMMAKLMEWLEEHAVEGTFVGLMAAEGVAEFYRRYGFEPRPEGRPGMYLVWPPPSRASGLKS